MNFDKEFFFPKTNNTTMLADIYSAIAQAKPKNYE